MGVEKWCGDKEKMRFLRGTQKQGVGEIMWVELSTV
jgi:hypothetical protein